MRAIGLFSGFGGFELACNHLGYEEVATCEKEAFPRQILQYYWPNAKHFGDINDSDFSNYAGKTDILTGGFPCQPFSTAGKREGTNDPRNLWPQMYRAVCEAKPTFVVAENVPGFINWGGGTAFKQVFSDLESEGYEVGAIVLPASAIGAPHQRNRLFIVAYSDVYRRRNGTDNQIGIARSRRKTNTCASANADGERQQERLFKSESGAKRQSFGMGAEAYTTNGSSFGFWRKIDRYRKTNEPYEVGSGGAWSGFPVEPPIRRRDDGLPFELDRTSISKQGFIRESIKGYGNAVIPQLAEIVIRHIEYSVLSH